MKCINLLFRRFKRKRKPHHPGHAGEGQQRVLQHVADRVTRVPAHLRNKHDYWLFKDHYLRSSTSGLEQKRKTNSTAPPVQ